MAKKLVFAAGEVLSNHTITGPGTSVAGHSCWSVTCNHCQSARNVRASALRAGTARCPCQGASSTSPTSPTLADAHLRLDFIEGQLVDLLEQIGNLTRGALSIPAEVLQRPKEPGTILPPIEDLPEPKEPPPPAADVPDTTKAKWAQRAEELQALATSRSDLDRFRKLMIDELSSAEMDRNYERSQQRLAVHKELSKILREWTNP